MSDELEPMPQGWRRLLAVVAHPDDLEHGAASAIARWTSAGRMAPSDAGFDPGEFLRGMTTEPGRALGVKHAVSFGRVQLAGV